MQEHVFPFFPQKNEEREAVLLLSDMVNYSGKVGGMPLPEIRNYMYNYHLKIREIIEKDGRKRHTFEPTAGDGTVVIYGCSTLEEKSELAELAVDTAIRIGKAIVMGELPATRIGLFSGKMIEAILDSHVLRFTLAFAAARRLEKLCDYFQTSFLMGKEIAQMQNRYKDNIVSIGKITPRHFTHPIHIFTVYAPGIHNCPFNVDEEQLRQFIRAKNDAVNCFCGNELEGKRPDFKLAREKLVQADKLFQQLSGMVDIATRRLLEYIDENPLPTPDFIAKGMRITLQRNIYPDIRNPDLTQTLLKSLNQQLYNNIVKLQEREREFDVLWYNAGDVIFRKGEQPDGIYFIATGSVRVEDPDNGQLAILKAGELFGEAAYFTEKKLRTATIIAEQDIVLRRMNGEELEMFPEIQNLFCEIANKRQKTLRF